MLCYFFFSDSYSTIASIGMVVAKVDMGLGIIMLGSAYVVITIFSGLGAILLPMFQKRMGYTVKTMVSIMIVWFIVVAVYGWLLKVMGGPVLNSWRQTVVFGFYAILYGSAVGAAQSYSRVMFSMLIPKGRESEFFAFFEISDRGSSWLGPAIAAIFTTTTGETLHVFGYIILVLILALFLLQGVEVMRAETEAQAESPRSGPTLSPSPETENQSGDGGIPIRPDTPSA